MTANAVCPGSTRTPMLDASARIYGLGSAEEFAGQHLLERLLDPPEPAAMIAWLCSGHGRRDRRRARGRRRDDDVVTGGPAGSGVKGRGGSMAEDECSHLDQIQDVAPLTPQGCGECMKTGDRWVHLRICLSCGEVNCCDSSPNKHARRRTSTAAVTR